MERTEEFRAFRDSVRRFAAAAIGNATPAAAVRAAGAHGFLGTTVPEHLGGGDADDHRFLAILVEEAVNAGSTGLALVLALHAGVVIPALLDHGSTDDQQRWVPELASGALIAVPAPGPTVPGVPGAGLADLLLVDGGAGDAVLVPVGAGPGADYLAAAEAMPVDIDVDVAAGTRLPDATTTMYRNIDLWLAVIALAGARRGLRLAVEYAGARKVFGQPLSEFENTQLRLAELAAELDCATTYVERCLASMENGSLSDTDAAAARHVAMNLSDRALDQSLQLHGGYGYMREYPIATAFADARFLRVAGQLYSDPRRVLARGLFAGGAGA